MNKNILFATAHNEAHDPLFSGYFWPSFRKHYNGAILRRHLIPTQGCEFGTDEFDRTALDREQWIADLAERAEPNQIIVSLDADMQFFAPTDWENELGAADLLTADDIYTPLCGGVMAFRNTPKMREFYRRRIALADADQSRNGGQGLMTQLAGEMDLKIAHVSRYFTTGYVRPEPWTGWDFAAPPDTAIHHANFCVGLDMKMRLLGEVRNQLTNPP